MVEDWLAPIYNMNRALRDQLPRRPPQGGSHGSSLNVYLRTICGFLMLIVVATAAQAQSPPSADKIFQLSTAKGAEGALVLSWVIAPGNYLYRDKIKVTSQ